MAFFRKLSGGINRLFESDEDRHIRLYVARYAGYAEQDAKDLAQYDLITGKKLPQSDSSDIQQIAPADVGVAHIAPPQTQSPHRFKFSNYISGLESSVGGIATRVKNHVLSGQWSTFPTFSYAGQKLGKGITRLGDFISDVAGPEAYRAVSSAYPFANFSKIREQVGGFLEGFKAAKRYEAGATTPIVTGNGDNSNGHGRRWKGWLSYLLSGNGHSNGKPSLIGSNIDNGHEPATLEQRVGGIEAGVRQEAQLVDAYASKAGSIREAMRAAFGNVLSRYGARAQHGQGDKPKEELPIGRAETPGHSYTTGREHSEGQGADSGSGRKVYELSGTDMSDPYFLKELGESYVDKPDPFSESMKKFGEAMQQVNRELVAKKRREDIRNFVKGAYVNLFGLNGKVNEGPRKKPDSKPAPVPRVANKGDRDIRIGELSEDLQRDSLEYQHPFSYGFASDLREIKKIFKNIIQVDNNTLLHHDLFKVDNNRALYSDVGHLASKAYRKGYVGNAAYAAALGVALVAIGIPAYYLNKPKPIEQGFATPIVSVQDSRQLPKAPKDLETKVSPFVAPPKEAPKSIEYEVKEGDTLAGIAGEFLRVSGVSNVKDLVGILANDNGIKDPNKIYIGQILKIQVGQEKPIPKQDYVHTVMAPQDSIGLYGIIDRYFPGLRIQDKKDLARKIQDDSGYVGRDINLIVENDKLKLPASYQGIEAQISQAQEGKQLSSLNSKDLDVRNKQSAVGYLSSALGIEKDKVAQKAIDITDAYARLNDAYGHEKAIDFLAKDAKAFGLNKLNEADVERAMQYALLHEINGAGRYASFKNLKIPRLA